MLLGVSPYGAIEFIAPVAGTYSIAGIFEKLNAAGNGEDVHVVVNGVSLYNQILVGGNTESDITGAFNLPAVALLAGDKVDFAVGPNSLTGDFGSDSVGFRGTLTVVPEPSSFILCGLGAIGLCAVARRRHKA